MMGNEYSFGQSRFSKVAFWRSEAYRLVPCVLGGLVLSLLWAWAAVLLWDNARYHVYALVFAGASPLMFLICSVWPLVSTWREAKRLAAERGPPF